MRTLLAAVLALVAVAAAAEDYIQPTFICRRPLFPPRCAAPEVPPEPWGDTPCADRKFDDALIESVANGDRSAVELMQRRYATAATYAERIRLGAALLGRVADDGAIWKELAGYAERAVELHADGGKEKLAAWCAAHDCEPDDYERLSREAFQEIAGDRRAHPLLLRALASSDETLVNDAIAGLAGQHDEASLPAIEEALRRLPDYASMLAYSLVDFESEAADRLALKYLRDDARKEYEEERAERKGGQT